MWFKNLQTYRLAGEWSLAPGAFEERLAAKPLTPCIGLNPQSRGWVPPAKSAQLVYAQNRQMLFALGIEQKLLPASVVRQEVEQRAEALSARQGFKAGRKQIRDLKDQVTAELMPRAFARRRVVRAWLDPVGGWLVIEAASPARAEELVEVLRDTLDGLALELPELAQSPAAAMTGWLAAGDAPGAFAVDQECELRGADAQKPTVRYLRHELGGVEVGNHIRAGKQVTRLGLRWYDRASFVLTDKFEVKKLRFEDIEQAREEATTLSEEEQFDAEFALMSAELGKLLAELSTAVGGEAEAERKAA